MTETRSQITVAIADDHDIVRRGLRMTIADEPDMSLVGEARNGREAIELVAATSADVLLLDIQMPEMDGVQAAQHIRSSYPKTAILMLTSYTDDARLYAAMRSGVQGYLLKEMSGDDLLAAIRSAVRGSPQLHPAIARRLMERLAPPEDPLADLTQREHDVLRQLVQGQSNKEIAAALHLTELTVKGYVREILSKLGVADRTQAALLAVRYGVSWSENPRT
jgi:DNA-binding NarL/FixJ family response regulator